MALSDWDTLTVDLKGDPLPGSFVSSDGYSIEVYKNWIYLGHPKFMTSGAEGGDWQTFGLLRQGEASFRQMEVFVGRGTTKRSVFVLAVEFHWNRETNESSYDGMIGIGCSGYRDREDDDSDQVITVDEEYQWPEFVGVEEAELTELTAFVNEIFSRSDYRYRQMTCPDLSRAVRFNQGNMFFARKLGDVDLVEASEVGEAGPTILSRMLGHTT